MSSRAIELALYIAAIALRAAPAIGAELEAVRQTLLGAQHQGRDVTDDELLAAVERLRAAGDRLEAAAR